jgi:iron-sulfur cluster assembly accessory protein
MATQDKLPSNESEIGAKSLTSISPSAVNGSHFQTLGCLPIISRQSLAICAVQIQTDPLPPQGVATLCEVTDATSDTPQTAIALTDKAAGKIAELLGSQEDSEGQALRVAVRGGGCSGFQYALAFDRAKDDDHIFEVDGVSVIVDKVSMQFVFGSEVDYVEGLQGAGFQVNNPNVVAACGCGSSFQVKDDAPAAETAAV